MPLFDSLLPDLAVVPDEPDAYLCVRRVSHLFAIVKKYSPDEATVDCLEYWAWNDSPVGIHHFLCATIRLQGELQLYIYERQTLQ